MPFASSTIADFLEHTAAKQPTPGGGAVAGVAGALACALAQMVVSYSVGKKSLEAHQPMLQDAQKRLTRARAMLLQLADEDAQAYGLVNELSRLPEGDARRSEHWPGAVRASVQVPLATAACAVDALELMTALAGTTNPHLRSDLGIAAVLAEATARASAWNTRINAPSLPTPAERSSALAQSDTLTQRARALAAQVETACATGA